MLCSTTIPLSWATRSWTQEVCKLNDSDLLCTRVERLKETCVEIPDAEDCTVGHKSHDPCFHELLTEAGAWFLWPTVHQTYSQKSRIKNAGIISVRWKTSHAESRFLDKRLTREQGFHQPPRQICSGHVRAQPGHQQSSNKKKYSENHSTSSDIHAVNSNRHLLSGRSIKTEGVVTRKLRVNSITHNYANYYVDIL